MLTTRAGGVHFGAAGGGGTAAAGEGAETGGRHPLEAAQGGGGRGELPAVPERDFRGGEARAQVRERTGGRREGKYRLMRNLALCLLPLPSWVTS